ncbi:MAG: MarR family transcriptional regulator [Alphaproteobacteria bacterium]|nr:MarR family transcriptional regulator [Alphaproteobacteria bacterium]
MKDDQPSPEAVASFEVLKRASVGQLLFKGARLFEELALGRLQAMSGDASIRPAHTALFPHIDFEGVRQTELADRVGVSKQAVGQLVRDLERMGMVRRDPDPTDGRARLVRFTKQGLEGMRHGVGVLIELETELTAQLGPERVDRLREDLAVLVEALGG